jgi:hypothetical protein
MDAFFFACTAARRSTVLASARSSESEEGRFGFRDPTDSRFDGARLHLGVSLAQSDDQKR